MISFWGGETVRAKLVRIGNSRGVRIPKSIIEQAGLCDEVELRLVESHIVIEAVSQLREGWSEAAGERVARGEFHLLDPITENDVDEPDWDW